MQSKIQLSVIVPVSRMHGKLEEFKSWVNNELPSEVQVIVVHDKQDDETGIELRKYLDELKIEIDFVESTFGSPGLARNAGFKIATGIWIAFWDSDDVPNVRNVLKELNQIETDRNFCIGGFLKSNLKTNQEKSNYPRGLFDVGFEPGIWRIIIRKSRLNNIRFSKYRMGEDQLFLAELDLVESECHYSKELFYSYYVGRDFQATSNPKLIAELRIVNLKIKELLIDEQVTNIDFSMTLYLRQSLTLLKQMNTQKALIYIFKMLQDYRVFNTDSRRILRSVCARFLVKFL